MRWHIEDMKTGDTVMTNAQTAKFEALNAYVAEVLSEMDAKTKAAFMSLPKVERQAMMWVGFHAEGRA